MDARDEGMGERFAVLGTTGGKRGCRDCGVALRGGEEGGGEQVGLIDGTNDDLVCRDCADKRLNATANIAAGNRTVEPREGGQFQTLRDAGRIYVVPLHGPPTRWAVYAVLGGWEWPIALWGEGFAGETLLPNQRYGGRRGKHTPPYRFEGNRKEVEASLRRFNPNAPIAFLEGWAPSDADGQDVE